MYTGDPSSSLKDQVRFILGDTDSCAELMTDGEITYLLATYSNKPICSAYHGARYLAMKYAKSADESVGSVRVSYSQVSVRYEEMALKLKQQCYEENGNANPYCGGISKSDKENVKANTDREQPAFAKDMEEYISTIDQRRYPY